MDHSYFMAMRSPELLDLLSHPSELQLYMLIAYRARRTKNKSLDGLSIGEALVGDIAVLGLTPRKYRTAKKNLEKWGFSTFKTTNKGTIAKIIITDVFDINAEESDKQSDEQATSKRQASDKQKTTNKKGKKGKKGNKTTISLTGDCPDHDDQDPLFHGNDTTGKPSKHKSCPHDKIKNLYHEVLPELPRIEVWPESAQACLRQRWREATERQSLEWWKWFFETKVATSDFLMGRRTNFVADLVWMVGPKNFAKIMNGKYVNRGTGDRRLDHNMRVMQEWLSEEYGEDDAIEVEATEVDDDKHGKEEWPCKYER